MAKILEFSSVPKVKSKSADLETRDVKQAMRELRQSYTDEEVEQMKAELDREVPDEG